MHRSCKLESKINSSSQGRIRKHEWIECIAVEHFCRTCEKTYEIYKTSHEYLDKRCMPKCQTHAQDNRNYTKKQHEIGEQNGQPKCCTSHSAHTKQTEDAILLVQHHLHIYVVLANNQMQKLIQLKRRAWWAMSAQSVTLPRTLSLRCEIKIYHPLG